ncbi:hypothetical protein JJL52_15595 [Methylomicrobium sp. RS1]|nr:hypothetical protein [Methylomicrobium sp. RS1]
MDGIAVLDDTSGVVGAGGITASALQSAIDTFASANSAAYTVTGTVAGGDLQISKLDGSAVVIASAFTDGSGGAAAGTTGGGTFSGAGFVGTTTAGTGTGVSAGVNAANHGTITLSSTSADGIVLGGAAAGNAGFTAGTTTATTTSSVNSIASLNVLTAANASKALDAIDGALQTINTSRASLGSYQNRFATVVDSLQTRTENLSASKSRITDADFAKETANLTRAQILQQAGTAMLSQANQLPQGVLSLLR